jgi:two-component system sensor histidine kinase ChiS
MKKIQLLIFIIISFLILSCGKGNREMPRVIAGTIDLRNWNFDTDGPVQLDGEWEFYWKYFISYEDLSSYRSVKTFIRVPYRWDDALSSEKNITYDGYATYHLKIFLREDQSDLAIRTYLISTAYNFFYNDLLVSAYGKIGNKEQETQPKYGTEVIELRNFEENQLDLIIHVSNFHKNSGGITRSIDIGKKKQIKNLFQKLELQQQILFGMIFIIGLYHLGIYSLRKEAISTFYFALFCITSAIRIFALGDRIGLLLNTNLSFDVYYKINYFCFFSSLAFFIRFMHSIFKEDINYYFQRIIFIIHFLLAFIILFIPTHFIGKIENIDRYIIIFIGFYLFYCLVKSIRKKREGAFIFTIGFVIIFSTVINDVLYSMNVIKSFSMVSYGLTLFILAQSFIISRRFSNAYRKSEILSSEIQKMNKIKDEFMSNLSHELRTPLSIIYAYSEIIKDFDGKGIKMIKVYGKEIYKEAGILIENINDLMLLTDLSTKFKLKHDIIKIETGIKQAIDYLDLFNYEKKVKFDLSSLKSIEIECDKVLFCKTFIILIKNAIIYNIPEGNIIISSTIEDGMVHLIVEDTGPGIPEKDLDRIFEKFYRVDSSVIYEISGVGVGLYIAKRIVKLLGGKIWAENKAVGKGAIFHVVIPLKIEE